MNKEVLGITEVRNCIGLQKKFPVKLTRTESQIAVQKSNRHIKWKFS